MDDPDVIARIHRHADGGAEDPVVRQRLGPERIHLETRRTRRRLAVLRRDGLLKHQAESMKRPRIR